MKSNQIEQPISNDLTFYCNQEESTKKTITPKKNVQEDLSNPETLINHFKQLVKKNKTPPHVDILQQLIEQFEPLDFEALAFPEVKKLRKQLEKTDPDSEQAKELRKRIDKIKLNSKHYRILSVKNTLMVADKNNWGLCKNYDFIYLFNGAFWASLEKDIFQKFLGEAAEQMGVKWDNAQDYQFREHLYKQFLATAILPTPKGEPKKVLINLQNGTFEISPKETKLRPFNRLDFMTYQLPFEYNPKAKAPLFNTYLNRVLPDTERQMVLAEYLGYIFIKNNSKILKEEKALILYGTGANGKSVFFEIVNALLGSENVVNHPLEILTDIDKGQSYRAKLANKLLNYASEISGRIKSSLFKQMVSGEPISACLKYGQPFNLENYAKFIFNCNELPKDVEHTNAYFRRFLIIPFDITIPEDEQDKNLHSKIIENELSGVFNWVLEGLNRLLKQKRFSNCLASRNALELYKTESNSLKMFLDENKYEVSNSEYFRIGELYSNYKAFCFDDGMHPFKKVNFSKQLQALGIRLDRESGTGQQIAYLKKEIEAY